MSWLSTLAIIAAAIDGLALAARALERGALEHGDIMSRPPTRTTRLITFLLGIVFGLWFLFDLFDGSTFVWLWPPILSAIFLLYSFGADKLVRNLERPPDDKEE
ncbi:MAG: hypothetical protein H0T73_04775 [Ardenticatenales bacterium]|nr:hypothetical protein [Ardenticatenales bacterium]